MVCTSINYAAKINAWRLSSYWCDCPYAAVPHADIHGLLPLAVSAFCTTETSQVFTTPPYLPLPSSLCLASSTPWVFDLWAADVLREQNCGFGQKYRQDQSHHCGTWFHKSLYCFSADQLQTDTHPDDANWSCVSEAKQSSSSVVSHRLTGCTTCALWGPSLCGFGCRIRVFKVNCEYFIVYLLLSELQIHGLQIKSLSPLLFMTNKNVFI